MRTDNMTKWSSAIAGCHLINQSDTRMCHWYVNRTNARLSWPHDSDTIVRASTNDHLWYTFSSVAAFLSGYHITFSDQNNNDLDTSTYCHLQTTKLHLVPAHLPCRMISTAQVCAAGHPASLIASSSTEVSYANQVFSYPTNKKISDWQ